MRKLLSTPQVLIMVSNSGLKCKTANTLLSYRNKKLKSGKKVFPNPLKKKNGQHMGGEYCMKQVLEGIENIKKYKEEQKKRKGDLGVNNFTKYKKRNKQEDSSNRNEKADTAFRLMSKALN